MRSIVLATRNPGKLREIKEVLADLPIEVASLETFEGIGEVEETGDTFAANARLKALGYARATAHWCLADDSGLVVDALGGAPGVHSARYAGETLPPGASRADIDAANNAKLLEALANVPPGERSARFVCHLALCDENEPLLEASGKMEGRIAEAPRGENGFGYDPLFIADQTDCTNAELSPDRKNAISHRGKALRRFAMMLRSYLATHR